MLAIRSLILTLCVTSTFAKHSPVLLWGIHSEGKSSLPVVASDEFGQLVASLLAANKSTMVVFMEKELRNEDLSCTNIADGNPCFAKLQDVSDKTYYAAVEKPVETLLKIKAEHEYNSVNEQGKLKKPLKTSDKKIIYVDLDKANPSTSRQSLLQSHDSTIASITSELGDNVFYMYTSATPVLPLKRQRRQTLDDSQGYVIRDEANLLFYFKSLSIIEGKSVIAFEIDKKNCQTLNQCTVKLENATTMSVALTPTTGTPLTFDISLESGYFFMKNVMYKNFKFPSSEVYAPTDFSYFCGNLTLNNLRSDSENDPSITLKWNSLQFQAPFGYTNNTAFTFGDPWHCVGFFTGSILSGLLIAILLLTITFIGICWMMDINTMDRFDDPKGKTITINASD